MNASIHPYSLVHSCKLLDNQSTSSRSVISLVLFSVLPHLSCLFYFFARLLLFFLLSHLLLSLSLPPNLPPISCLFSSKSSHSSSWPLPSLTNLLSPSSLPMPLRPATPHSSLPFLILLSSYSSSSFLFSSSSLTFPLSSSFMALPSCSSLIILYFALIPI